MMASRRRSRVERDAWPEPPALRSWCVLCREEVRITAGAVVLSEPPGVAHGSCAGVLPERRKHSRRRISWGDVAGWLLLVHTALVAWAMWSLGAGHYGLAVFLTFLAALAIFFAWELDS